VRSGSDFQILASVVMDSQQCGRTERLSGSTIEDFIPQENLENFEEFHAADVMHKNGAFAGLSDDDAVGILEQLVRLVTEMKAAVVYGAVDRRKFNSSLYAGVDAAQLAFRICLAGVEKVDAR
jgi:hypothetical protein